MTAIDTFNREKSSDRLTEIVAGMRDTFGDRAPGVARRQFEAAEGDARAVWQRIVSALSGQ